MSARTRGPLNSHLFYAEATPASIRMNILKFLSPASPWLRRAVEVQYCTSTEKPKSPLRGTLAKQNRMGYALIDVVAKVYSHSFTGIIAEDMHVCQITQNVRDSNVNHCPCANPRTAPERSLQMRCDAGHPSRSRIFFQ